MVSVDRRAAASMRNERSLVSLQSYFCNFALNGKERFEMWDGQSL